MSTPKEKRPRTKMVEEWQQCHKDLQWMLRHHGAWMRPTYYRFEKAMILEISDMVWFCKASGIQPPDHFDDGDILTLPLELHPQVDLDDECTFASLSGVVM